ncbi:MAG: hypothetical protein ACIAQZ_06090 [Sedimentisphaeraceae bacterium JB056]
MQLLKILSISLAGGTMVSLYLENILSKNALIFSVIIILTTAIVSLAELCNNITGIVIGSLITAIFLGFLIEDTGTDIAITGKFLFFIMFISVAHILQFLCRE